MQLSTFNQYFGNVDIYLLDLILKNRFHRDMKVLDAGCGEGRNLMYFLNAGYTVYGIDIDPLAVKTIQFVAASIRSDLNRDHFRVARIDKLPYSDDTFDLVLASAVLHFASSESHFYQMFAELIRCLKPGGLLFVRMTSDIGIEKEVVPKGDGRFLIPDGTERFLLNRDHVSKLKEIHSLEFLQPLKTVNVDDRRCMTTMVLSVA